MDHNLKENTFLVHFQHSNIEPSLRDIFGKLNYHSIVFDRNLFDVKKSLLHLRCRDYMNLIKNKSYLKIVGFNIDNNFKHDHLNKSMFNNDKICENKILTTTQTKSENEKEKKEPVLKKEKANKKPKIIKEKDLAKIKNEFKLLKKYSSNSQSHTNLIFNDKNKPTTVKLDENYFCPIDLLPIHTRKDYTISPSTIEIHRMTQKQLENVEAFTIGNYFGSITWPGTTNLLRVNFDNIVHIGKYKAEVYPEFLYPKEELKDPRGTKLNKSARITLNFINVSPAVKDIDGFFEKNAKIQECKHISYCPESATWTFEVPHF